MVTIKYGVQRGYENSVSKFQKQLCPSGVVDISQIVKPTYEQLRYYLSQGFFDANRNTARQISKIKQPESQKFLMQRLGLINEAILELNDPLEVFDYPLLGTPIQDVYINEIAKIINNMEINVKEMIDFYGINYLNTAKKVVDNCNFVKTDAGLYLLNPA